MQPMPPTPPTQPERPKAKSKPPALKRGRWLFIVRRKREDAAPEVSQVHPEDSLSPEQCLNCGAMVVGKYCAECGQEHSEKAVSLGRLIAEFLDDTFSLDSKLLKTTALLLFRPGFLTNEYNAGRRARYLSPWRMYVFTSVLLFFLLSLQAPSMNVTAGDNLMPHALRADARPGRTILTWEGVPEAASYKVKRAGAEDGPFRDMATGLTARRYVDRSARGDAPLFYTVTAQAEDGRRATSDVLRVEPPVGGKPVVSRSHDQMLEGEITIGARRVKLSELPDTVEDYEAAQQRLPARQRDGWFAKAIIRRSIEYRNTGLRGLQAHWSRGLVENAPKVMFVMLPLFALLLKGLYFRRRRLYIEHLVFALHTHAFLFALLSVELLLRGRYEGVMFGLSLIYVFAAMLMVYRQSLLKTSAKFALLLLSYTILLSFGLLGVVLLTLVTG